MAWRLLFGLLSSIFIGSVLSDVYMHNPRGSNDRLFTANTNRQNANRLFDSQNNARGGYNVGESGSQPAKNESEFYKMVYFQSGSSKGEDSQVTVELYYQHGCSSDENGKCNLVFQFICQPEADAEKSATWQLRDGSTENTPDFSVPKKVNETAVEIAARRTNDLNTSKLTGQQESWDSYNQCYLRRRNSGLFIADQRLGRNSLNYTSAIFTRQDAKGTRYGYECPEERDYYPYWYPNQWKDIAVLTDGNDCSYYKSASFTGNVTLGVCVKADGTRDAAQLQIETASNCTGSGFKWVQVYNYLEKAPKYNKQALCTSQSTDRATFIWGVPYDAANFNTAECLVAVPTVDCQKAPWARPNHLGVDRNTDEFPRYTWTLPYFPSQTVQRCVLRVRYNMSSSDYDHKKTDASSNQVQPNEVAEKYRRIYQVKAAEIQQWKGATKQQINNATNALRETLKKQADYEITNGNSPVRQNPRVQLFPNFPELVLAINTDQTGRVFEDRSHAFRLAPRPQQVPPGSKIYNLNVRGKRGNNAQAYNAVEYDFVPNNLKITSTDLVHIQWTGSNNQPGDGQGRQNTDRSNLVQIDKYSANYPLTAGNITMLRNANVVWTMFQSANLFSIDVGSKSAVSIANSQMKQQQTSDSESAAKIKQLTDNYLSLAISDSNGPVPNVPDALKNDADVQPYDLEKNLDDAKPARLQAMRKKRGAGSPNATAPGVVIGVGGITDQHLGLALATSGYFWCVNKTDCPSFVGDSYILSVASNKTKLGGTLDEASASFPGIMLSFKRGTYNYMSTRNNKFSNRSQKGRIVVS